MKRRFDFILLFLFVILYLFGVLWQFSAGSVEYLKFGEFYTFKRHLIFASISFIFLFVSIYISKKTLLFLIKPIFFLSILLLVLVYIPYFNQNTLHKRWIYLFGLSFQPSELFKLTSILYTSFVLTRDYLLWKRFTYLLPLFLYIFLGVTLILFETDLSTSMLIYLIFFLMILVGTYKFKHIIIPSSILILFPVAILMKEEWRIRIISTLNPFKYITNEGYQVAQSLIAIASGGLFGVGYMNGKQKFDYIPLVSKDFIFALICEESGLLGASILLLILFLILYRGLRISLKVNDPFLKLLSFGITTHLVLQSLTVIGVNIGFFPVTGLPLPFISYGGTALLINGIEAGLLLNISRYVE
ncbi:MAG: FtsW/RodA/SpoVE family cell cycle protein [Caldisericia bacterium]|jgi:cell division protein FtsW|nr:FtsW/RodA/SpoVE family cell cycle protein [Caldisericia bacterium]